jgi:hypothetical protein
VAVAAIGYFFYNKGPLDVKNSSAIKINAGELYEAFDKDSITAGKKYTDKILAVNGEVNEVSVNQQQKKVVLLKTMSELGFINCTMEEAVENIKIGDKINIKGICSGIGSGDADMGIKGDVYLTRCYLEK